MEIQHHGAVNGVTGSCHQLTLTDGNSILIDCGLFQGAETSGAGASSSQQAIEFPVDTINALVVTHVHIDHVGRIPYLLAAGFKGPIYCSEASAQLLPLVLEDAIKIGFTRDKILVERFLRRIKQQIIAVPYRSWTRVIGPDKPDGPINNTLDIKLQPAGHILGSAYVECRCREHNKKEHRIVFSGDLGATHAPLLPAPKSPYRADTLIIESTYGDRQHQGRRQRRLQLKAIIEKSLKDRGAVLIPAFSIGRTQEILYELESIIHDFDGNAAGDNSWKNLEIIVDSPLAANFTSAYRSLKQFWDKEALARVKDGRHPLDFEQLYTVSSHQQHLDSIEYIQRKNHPCIVIAASGMCAGGRIMNYLKALISSEQTDILFIGYQAAGTPGRTIQQYGPENGYVTLDGERHTINAQIHTLSGYSAHADQRNLLNFIKGIRVRPKEVRIVHGDNDAKEAFAREVKQLLPRSKILIPSNAG